MLFSYFDRSIQMHTQNHRITRTIHWLMAAFIIGMLILGLYMKNTESYEFYALHKSMGVVAIFLIGLRLYWRWKQPWQSSSQGTQQEKLVTRVHSSLLLLLTLMPVTGLMLSGLGGYGVAIFGLQIIPSNYAPSGEAIPFNRILSDFGYAAHEALGYLLSTLVFLHLCAALKHHFVDSDNTLKRMMGTKNNKDTY